jgi:hypothetical protein
MSILKRKVGFYDGILVLKKKKKKEHLTSYYFELAYLLVKT